MSGMAAVLAAHVVITDGLYEPTGWCATCGNLADGDQEEHQAFALSVAGFGDVTEARARALREAAERFKTRSDTLHNTMKEMTASREYGVEDIVRYGAYSSEANGAATWLRTRATLPKSA